MKSKANLLLVAWLLNVVFLTLTWGQYVARNEEATYRTYFLSFWGGALLLVGILVSLFVVKDSFYRRAAALTVLSGFGIAGMAGYTGTTLRTFRFSQDVVVLEKAVAEVQTTGNSTAWKSVAYEMLVLPKTGPPQTIYFIIAKQDGKPCQWYRWTKVAYPSSSPIKLPTGTETAKGSSKSSMSNKSAKRVFHCYWLAPQWFEYTRL